jgi:hypothetical protein
MEPRKRRFLVVNSVQAQLTRQRISPEQLAGAVRISLSVLAHRLAGEGSFSVDELDCGGRRTWGHRRLAPHDGWEKVAPINMGTGETRGMRVILDMGVLDAAAARIGITDHEGLAAHLGMEVTQSASMLLIAVV